MLTMVLTSKTLPAVMAITAAAQSALADDDLTPAGNCALLSVAGEAAPSEATAIMKKLPAWLEETDTPSVSAAYVEKNALKWSLVCGEQSDGAPATLDTRYNTASIAKPVVGEIVLRLASEGRVSLDESMTAFWLDPDIADDPRAQQLTPRLALSHQTGFANWRRMTDGALSFRWDPGTQVGYSGEGIRYVARFLEKKLDKPFNDIAGEVLFNPIGMTESSFIFEPEFEGRAAHRWRGEAQGGWGEPYRNTASLSAARLWTTSADYARIMIAVMTNSGTTPALSEARGVINRDDVARMCGPDKRKPAELCPERMGFGVGWYVYEFGDRRFYGHTGANVGERSMAVMEPATGSGLVVFANGENGNAAISKIARMVYGDDNPVLALEGF